MKRSLTGIKPTGDIHIGNYLGAIRPGIERQKSFHCLYFIADMHALTTNENPVHLRKQTLDITATWLAAGLDATKHVLWRQSDVAMVAEYAWYLSCVTGFGLLSKAHAFKDAEAKRKEVNHGLFAYPTLMAADIMMYDADVVPVGKDQKQHVEMARDMAGSFNSIYGEGVIKLPEVAIEEKVMVVPGLDGAKMSKSYGNVIPLFSDEKTLRKLVLSIKTDSTPLEEPKNLAETPVGILLEAFAGSARYKDLEGRMSKGGLGWGHAKEEVFEAINTAISPIRTRYQEIRQDEPYLNQTLKLGAEKAHAIGLPVLNRARAAVGFLPVG
jgi:tryptophanyl-tRNA synthetase